MILAGFVLILQFFRIRFYNVARLIGRRNRRPEMLLIAGVVVAAFGALVALLRRSLMTLDRWRSRKRPVPLTIPLDRRFE